MIQFPQESESFIGNQTLWYIVAQCLLYSNFPETVTALLSIVSLFTLKSILHWIKKFFDHPTHLCKDFIVYKRIGMAWPLPFVI